MHIYTHKYKDGAANGWQSQEVTSGSRDNQHTELLSTIYYVLGPHIL